MMFHPKEPLYGPGPNPADEPDGWCRVCKGDTFEGVCDHCKKCYTCGEMFDPDTLPKRDESCEPECGICRSVNDEA